MGETGQAVIEWLQTFDAGKNCNSLVDLVDGSILADVLHEICPEHFEAHQISNSNDNWALAAGNLRKLLRTINEYFENVLAKSMDTDSVDVNEIAKSSNADEIFNLVEIIIGVAVLSEHKNQFIKHVLTLPESSQAILKDFVEGALSKVTDIVVEEDEEEVRNAPENLDGNASLSVDYLPSNEAVVKLKESNNNDELFRANEMINHLTSKQTELLQQLHAMNVKYDALLQTHNSVVAKQHAQAHEKDSQAHHENYQKSTTEALNENLIKELDELKHNYDLQKLENEQLKAEKVQLVKSLEGSKEIIKKLEMENQMQNDEIDIQQEKLAKLSKLEANLEKYSKKLEEMQNIKKQNKELNENLDKYLDQIHDLESTNKSLSNSLKIMEMYKVKNVELEKEKIEILSKSQLVEEQYSTLQNENSRLIQKWNTQKVEIDQLNQQLYQYQEESSGNRGSGTFASPDRGFHDLEESLEMDSIPKLKEKVKLLERSLAQYQSGNAGAASLTMDGVDVSYLQAQIEDLKSQKTHSEHQLIQSRKQSHSLEQEVSALKQQLANGSTAMTSGNAQDAKEFKDLQMKAAVNQKAMKMIEEKLQEKESVINRLEQEKNKLENYAKRQLSTFKEKFMLTLQTMRNEKKELEDRINLQTMKFEKNQETWRREEKLLSSALFEIGVKIMDRKLQSQLQTSFANDINGSSPYLQIQREAIFQAAAGPSPASASISSTPNTVVAASNSSNALAGKLFGSPTK